MEKVLLRNKMGEWCDLMLAAGKLKGRKERSRVVEEKVATKEEFSSCMEWEEGKGEKDDVRALVIEIYEGGGRGVWQGVSG